MKIAKEKAWAALDGTTLVKHGDPKAEVLVAGKGQTIHEANIEKYSNADEFFEDVNPRPSTAHKERKRVTEDAPEEEPAHKGKKK